VFHNIVTLSRALERLRADGLKASDQALAALTPYQTEHINRFGNYTVNFSRTPEPLPSNLREPAGTESIGQASFDYTSLSWIKHLKLCEDFVRIVLAGLNDSTGPSLAA
jgi:hypothetical protein